MQQPFFKNRNDRRFTPRCKDFFSVQTFEAKNVSELDKINTLLLRRARGILSGPYALYHLRVWSFLYICASVGGPSDTSHRGSFEVLDEIEAAGGVKLDVEVFWLAVQSTR